MKTNKPKFTILLPTYNESANINPLLKRIRKAMSGLKYSYEILFVDDSSDETPEIIKKASKTHKNIRLLHREKGERTGLATALAMGFKNAKGEYICSLDSDLQHPPEKIPEMITKIIDEDVDIVVASRYIKGGSAKGLGTNYRKFVSLATRLVAWIIIPETRKTSDSVSGFFAVRTSLIRNLSSDSLFGYKILIDMLARTPLSRVAEVPCKFVLRENNDSKATFEQGIQFIRQIIKLYFSFQFIRNIKTAFILLAIGIFAFALSMIMGMANTGTEKMIVLVAVFLSFQGTFTVFLMIYAWEHPARVKAHRAPEQFSKAKYSFTAILPARHEEQVIADTIKCISEIDYPESKKELLIMINNQDDDETIRIAKETIKKIAKKNIRLVSFSGPLGKAIGLNKGMDMAKKKVVTIFDAEDKIHKDIYSVVNSVMIRDDADVVQSGVQLMNLNSSWYSLFNVLEYFFWFKSALHFFAKQDIITLGGNTVFFKKNWLKKVGGWDAKNLTEDADIAIRLCTTGARVRVVYDERYATREETPHSLVSFIKQRTRWNQGFIQILFKGEWLRLPKIRQKLLALYVLLWPIIQGSLFILLPFSIIAGVTVKMTPLLGIISNLPLYVFASLFVVVNLGLYDFTKSYGMSYSPILILKLFFFFIPYQILLGISAFRAVVRQIGGNISWEKTTHLNILNSEEILNTGDK